MNKIEQVARALCHQIYKNNHDLVEAVVERNWKLYIDMAKAAIEAMREPTEGMIKAGDGACNDYGSPEVVWQNMIEKALEK